VVAAGTFDGDDQVAELVLRGGAAEEVEGGVEIGSADGEGGGWDQDVAVEVGGEPLAAGLGAIDGDDAEVVGADGLDAWMEGAGGLVDGGVGAVPAAPAGAGCGHGNNLLR